MSGILGTFIIGMFPMSREYLLSAPGPPPYVTGDRLAVLPPGFPLQRRNVVVFSRHDCGACQRSKAPLTGLVAELGSQPAVQVIFIVPGALNDDEVAFAEEVGVRRPRVIGVTLRGTPIRRVPSVAVVDENGKILEFHEGLVTDDTKAELARMATG